MPNREVFRPWVAALCLMIILGFFAARCLLAARANSVTFDERIYIACSLHFWMTGDDLRLWGAGVPRLPHLINAAVPYLLLRQSGRLPDVSRDPGEILYRFVMDDVRTVILSARRVAIGWGILSLLVVYWGVARSFGAALGLVAAALLSMVPEMLAHASLAGSDMPCAAAMLLALCTLARYAERPSLARWMVMALAIGLAWAMRHTAILLIPVAVVVDVWVAFRKPRPPGMLAIGKRLAGTACTSAALVLIAFTVLWAADGFGTVPLGSEKNPSHSLRAIRRVGQLDVSRLPIPTSVLSLKFQIDHAKEGQRAYFCGEGGDRGWLLYFPVAFLLKTPIGLLILIALALVRVRPRGSWDWILLGCLGLLWIVLVRNKIDIGLRYAILTYSLIIPFVARLFETSMLRDRIWGAITIAATLLFVSESLSCQSRYLSSFNQLGGGSRLGWLYLADSNIDWRQDIDALAGALKELGIDEITNAVWPTSRTPVLPGVRIMPIGETGHNDLLKGSTAQKRRLHHSDDSYETIPTRYVAVSVNSMVALYKGGDLRWLWTRRLVSRVNDSIFVFDMDEPAAEPFVR
jgi:hypothetical protein